VEIPWDIHQSRVVYYGLERMNEVINPPERIRLKSIEKTRGIAVINNLSMSGC